MKVSSVKVSSLKVPSEMVPSVMVPSAISSTLQRSGFSYNELYELEFPLIKYPWDLDFG